VEEFTMQCPFCRQDLNSDGTCSYCGRVPHNLGGTLDSVVLKLGGFVLLAGAVLIAFIF
jgi:hypothetical protein